MKIIVDKEKIEDVLTRGVEQLIEKNSLIEKLSSGRQLRIKHGVDPTTKDLHLGYAVVYEKLKKLQEMGHKIVFLIGDFTARFGDPTQKIETRKMKSKKEVMVLAKNYISQLGKIIDIKKTEIRYNGEWYDKMSAEGLLQLVSNFNHARMIERDMFQERIKKGLSIGLHELLYPVLQGYDSVALKSDLTVIGTDQIFNELCGRQLQEEFGQKPQNLIAMKILIGTDGHKKMSQSLDNYVAFNDLAKEQYGKIMSIPDELLTDYFILLTRLSLTDLEKIKNDLANNRLNPRDAKALLARQIVGNFYGEKEAQKAEDEFNRVFRQKNKPSEMMEIKVDKNQYNILDFLTKVGISSKSEAKRLIEQKGVKINDQIITDWRLTIEVKDKMIIQWGKRNFVKIVVD